MNPLIDLIHNPFLITAVSSWFIGQILKTVINAILTKKISLERMVGDGGMPSCHSATVSSLALMTGLIEGFNTPIFAIASILAIIVCHDAMGVRLETGKQAVLLNDIVDLFRKLAEEEELPEVKLKEFVGHTPLQVLAGIVLGLINALVMYFLVFRFA